MSPHATRDQPCFLVLQVPDTLAAGRAFPALGRLADAAGADVLASAPPREVEVLETGTALEAVMILRWRDRATLLRWWHGAQVREAAAPVTALEASRVSCVIGIPTAGLPGDPLPTVATVDAPRLDTPPAYMLVQGSVTAVEPIQQYLAVIVPMLRERSGFYIVHAGSPDVDVLHGEWNEQVFIISRWPTLAAARDFWWCDRYQHTAIPLRSGHGAFTVLLLPGLAG
jgi:uncharacterized protein (DUF1330 family)